MSLKFVLNNEIYKATNFPADFGLLLEQVKSKFAGQLTSAFTIQYQDQDGDKVVIANNEDYKEVIQTLGKTNLKLFIVPKSQQSKTPLSQSQSQMSSSIKESQNFEILEEKPSTEIKT
jgi:hypothetical protein